MSAYLLGSFFLIKKVSVYQSGIADKNGQENEIPLLFVCTQECVRESNDAGSQKYHTMTIHGLSGEFELTSTATRGRPNSEQGNRF